MSLHGKSGSIWRSLSLIERDDTWRLVLSICLSGLIALLELGIAGLIATLSALFSLGGESSSDQLEALAFIKQLKILVSWIYEGRSYSMILGCLTLIIMTLALRGVIALCYTWHSVTLAERVSGRCRARMIKLYQEAPHLWLKRQSFADQQYNVGVTVVISSLISQALNALTNALMLVALLIGFVLISTSHSLVFVLGAAVIGAVLIRFIRLTLKKQSDKVLHHELELNSLSYMALHGLNELRVYHRAEAIYQRVLGVLERFMRGRVWQQTLSILPIMSLELIGFTILFLIAASMSGGDGMQLSDLSAQVGLFAATAWRALPMFNRLLSGISALEVMRPQLERITTLFEASREWWTEPSDAQKQIQGLGDHHPLILSVDGLSFTYPDQEMSEHTGRGQRLINHISFEVSEGESLAVVGASGLGKSTLAQLLIALMPADEGEVSLGNLTLSPQHLGEWRRQVRYVSQSPYLFNVSLAENITLATWRDEPLRAEEHRRLRECCDLAQIDFIETLDDGLNTIIGDEGARLSGGQAQRVAIARALYHQAPVLILDESTSALDPLTEKRLMDALLALLQSPASSLKILILVTHKEGLAQRCDHLLDLGETS